MTNGGMTREEAAARQQFTGRTHCEHAHDYDGKTEPKCDPYCEACLIIWVNRGMPNG